MAFIQKYRAWVTERARQVNNAEEEQLLNDILIFVITHEILRINSEEKKKRIYKKKRFWVHPVFKLRNRHGFYHAIYPTLSRYEPKFKNYMRMSLSQFEELLALVALYICPHNAGSLYYNYKNYHSIVLLGICDANYMFTFVDIGSYGRRSDDGIFRDSIVGQKFYNKEMGLPEPEKLTVDGDPMPYVLVGDEAF
ncbi:hypothetical protein ALC62_12646 [Cyphomyrmex costatus]|uniref:DDE Tnp4 domain-containing protein n=1 Tax=Cyphomyrmex costatus TaxID=456900 RepID=A0A151IAX5_9HYME|nr:hypothetical protein ALC62_12646 [Cyphomyrmex costatus]